MTNRTANRIPQESLELLDAIDRRGSFARAAEELGRATSAVSYGVQKLEEHLGITIFVRRGRKSVLTPAGRLLLDEGRVILAASARLADRARELARGWEPRIRIGAESTLDQRLLFEVLAQFRREHPDVEIDVSETLLNGSWEALEHKRVDMLVGAVGPVPAHKGFRAVSLGKADLVPVIGRKHPEADRIVADQHDTSAPLVVTHDTVTTEVARNAGLALEERATFYVQTTEQKMLAIQAGLGVGHLPRHRIGSALAEGELVPLSIEPVNPEQFIAWELTNRGKGLGRLVQALQAVDW